MKSLLVNYLNSRRSVHIQETIVDDTETVSAVRNELTPASSRRSSSEETKYRPEVATFLNLNIKYIDDNDTDSMLSNGSVNKSCALDDEVEETEICAKSKFYNAVVDGSGGADNENLTVNNLNNRKFFSFFGLFFRLRS